MSKRKERRILLLTILLVGAPFMAADAEPEPSAKLTAVAAHASEAPVRPSVRIGLPLPASLERIVLACLAKEPARDPDRPLCGKSRPDGNARAQSPGLRFGPC